MEEYRDLQLTVVAFTKVLDEPEFHHLEAGIVLQAYLPDSHDVLEHLGEWAAARRDSGGAGIKIRIVKGANLAMEAVEAELHDWVAAPYPTKADVDASYKLMLESALRPEWSGAIRVGVASHNLFDVAWALVAARPASVDQRPRIELEMLEGMAPAQSRAVRKMAGSLLLYAPVVQHDQIDASIAYLARRLDENTAPENFLRALFTITPGSAEFAEQADRFRRSVAERHQIPTARRRLRRTRHTTRGSPTSPTAIRRIPRCATGCTVQCTAAPADRPMAVVDSIGGDRCRRRDGGRRRADMGGHRCRSSVAGSSPRSPRSSAANVSTPSGDGRRGREGRPRGRSRGQRGDRLRQVLRHGRSRCRRAAAGRGCRAVTHVASSWWPRRGTSRTRSLPAACSPHWPPATP